MQVDGSSVTIRAKHQAGDLALRICSFLSGVTAEVLARVTPQGENKIKYKADKPERKNYTVSIYR